MKHMLFGDTVEDLRLNYLIFIEWLEEHHQLEKQGFKFNLVNATYGFTTNGWRTLEIMYEII